jgi:hypothetical protein
MTTYKIIWAHGQTDTGFATLDDAEVAVRSVLTDAEIGHSGDISDGGERTLFWSSESDSVNDDGEKSAGSIRACHDDDAVQS